MSLLTYPKFGSDVCYRYIILYQGECLSQFAFYFHTANYLAAILNYNSTTDYGKYDAKNLRIHLKGDRYQKHFHFASISMPRLEIAAVCKW